MTKKYKWKCRIILINTPSYRHIEYKKAKTLYQKKIKDFHKRFIKLAILIKKNQNFNVQLIEFNGVKKKKFKTFNSIKIIKSFDKQPLKKFLQNKKIKPLNLSLYSDYNPKTTTHGLGFKNKEKALHTVKAIRKKKLRYQVNVVATMLGRAKKHPNQTREMLEAIKVFKKWMLKYKKSSK